MNNQNELVNEKPYLRFFRRPGSAGLCLRFNLTLSGALIMLSLLLAAYVSYINATGACGSAYASYWGDWKPINSAPRNGSVVKLLNTNPLLPTYSLVNWTSILPVGWKEVNSPEVSPGGNACLYWRAAAPRDLAEYPSANKPLSPRSSASRITLPKDSIMLATKSGKIRIWSLTSPFHVIAEIDPSRR
jgi:hypothetical protein